VLAPSLAAIAALRRLSSAFAAALRRHQRATFLAINVRTALRMAVGRGCLST
jgi:hypothetical protein